MFGGSSFASTRNETFFGMAAAAATSSVVSDRGGGVGVGGNQCEAVSTTKALLLSLTLPRTHRIYVPPKTISLPTASNSSNSTTKNTASAMKTKTTAGTASNTTTTTQKDNNNNNNSSKQQQQVVQKDSSSSIKEKEKEENGNTSTLEKMKKLGKKASKILESSNSSTIKEEEDVDIQKEQEEEEDDDEKEGNVEEEEDIIVVAANKEDKEGAKQKGNNTKEDTKQKGKNTATNKESSGKTSDTVKSASLTTESTTVTTTATVSSSTQKGTDDENTKKDNNGGDDNGNDDDHDGDDNNVEVMEEEEEHEEVGYVQEDSQDFSKDVVVEHVVTKEEMSAIVKIDENEDEIMEPANNANGEGDGNDGNDGSDSNNNKKKKKEGQTDDDDDKKSDKSKKDDDGKEGNKDDDDNDDDDDSKDKSSTKHGKTPSAIDSTMSNITKMIFAVMNPSGTGDENGVMLDREQTIEALQRASQSELPSMSSLGEIPTSTNNNSNNNNDDSKTDDKPQLQIQQKDPFKPNTEIRVEALVRMTFRNLFLEGHFFNLPIYTQIDSRQVDDITDSTKPNFTPIQEWVQVDVMVKDPSIGLILERLERIGIGSSVGTVSIFKAELCRTAVEQVAFLRTSKDNANSNSADNTPNSSRHGNNNNAKKLLTGGSSIGGGGDQTGTTTNRNEDGTIVSPPQADPQKKLEAARAEWKNAASRLRVEQVKEQIHEQAKLSFDFLSLLTIASILAGIGLIVNSTVVIVASMLVSPIMGPVMGMTFGSRVLDWRLAKISAAVESVALLLAVLIGAIIGISTSWSPVSEEWPTDEMIGRGDVVGLLTGVAIAIPSGMGVALSILGNNTASLVGVAISASLLPPAVNAGVCWAHALLIKANAVETDSDEDFAAIGAISFALVVVNILCIWLSGMLMFAIKEVAPSKSTSAFWSRDIKVARAIKRGNQNVDMDVIKEGIQNELKTRRKAGKPAPPLQSKRPAAPDSPKRKKSKQNVLEVEEEDSVRYVGLEDMAHFLGFDEEDDEWEEDAEKPEGKGFWDMVGWLG